MRFKYFALVEHPPSAFLLFQQIPHWLEVQVTLHVLSQRFVIVPRWTGIYQTNPDAVQAHEGMYSTNLSPLQSDGHHSR